MRVLIASWHRGIVGGTERYLQSIIPGLMARGHEIAVIHGYDVEPASPRIDPPGIVLPGWAAERLGTHGALHEVGAWQPDVLFAHGSRSPDLEEALLERYPAVLFGHDYYGTCATATKCHSFPQPRPCTRTFGPACLLLHYPRRCGGLNPLKMWSSYRLQGRRHAFLSRYDAIAVASGHMREEFLRHGVDGDRLHLIPLASSGGAVDPSPPALRPFTNRVLFVGQLTGTKGGSFLVRALPIASRALGRTLTLGMVGSGRDRDELERLARGQGTPVEFPGWVDTDRRIAMMRAADVLAVPSVWPEPFGLVGLEAGSLGLPAVGFAVGGIPDWLVPGTSGELAPGNPPTVEGLADALVRALRDHQRHHDLRRGAWEMAGRFSLDAHLRALEPLLVEIAGAR